MPRLPASDPVSKALAELRRRFERLEKSADLDELLDANAALLDSELERDHQQRVNQMVRGPADSGIIPLALAHRLADGSWRAEP